MKALREIRVYEVISYFAHLSGISLKATGP
jgi:hypothetical protein